MPNLPEICSPDKHKWAELTPHGCGAGSGDHAIGELLVAGFAKPGGGKGTACTICFQLFGQSEGTRSEELEFAFKALLAYSNLL